MNQENVCPFCGKTIHPGDQKCVSCGKIIPNVQFSLKDLEGKNQVISKKKHIDFVVALFFILIVFFLLLFFLVR